MFLALLGALVGGFATAATSMPAGRAARLDAALSDIDAAARLGRRYLATLSKSPDPGRLVDEIESGLAAAPGGPPPWDVEEVTARARWAVDQDYLQGRVTDVGGWVLSLTEAKLFALAALSLPHPD